MEYASSAFRDVCIQAALELAQADALAAAQTPEFVPSARFTRRMRRLLPHVKKNKYRSLTTAARVALVAALLALLALSAVAARHYGFDLNICYDLVGWNGLARVPESSKKRDGVLHLAEMCEFYDRGMVDFYQIEKEVRKDFGLETESQFKALIQQLKEGFAEN